MIKYFVEMQKRLENHPFLDDIKDFILSFGDENLKKYLSFLYLNMPYADLANISKEVILDYAEAGVNLRKNRCKNMDEDIFLNYILFHRIGSEKIVANRTFFFDLIKDLLGDDEKENVIRLNYWCGKNVTYRNTDDRTMDPISVYESSFGRCGEESIFAVSVLRAAGIPARQLYVPLWAHCDDNHAWVEVYVNGEWHYLGACEPEEILDKGWFDDAAARAMIVKSILYSKPESDDILSFNYGLYELNQTKRYADCKHIRLHLTDDNNILGNVPFNICLLNYAGLFPIIRAITSDSGIYETDIGFGTVFLSLYKDKNYIIPINTDEKEDFYIDIKDFEPEYNRYKEILIKVPSASTRNRKKAPAKRETGYKEKRAVNIDTGKKAVSEGIEPLWDILCEKDKRDISIEILRECYFTKNTYNVEPEIYLNYIQNPRVEFENLNQCREVLQENFSDIDDLLSFVSKIKLTRERTVTEPLGVFKTKIASALSVKIFAVNVLRAIGVASKLENSEIFIYKDSSFICFTEFSKILAKLKYIDSLSINREEDVKVENTAQLHIKGDLSSFGETFVLAKHNEYENALVSLDKGSIRENMQLPAGEYLLTTSGRLPIGNICCKYNILKLEENQSYDIELEYMSADIKDMLTKFILPKELQEKLGIYDNELSLLIWIGEEEPTQHIANDLLSKSELLENLELKLLFTNEFEKKDNAVNELLEKSVKNKIYTKLGEGLQEAFGRSLFVNHETLPIVALCKNNIAVYAFSGYQAGTGNLIDKIRKLCENGSKS